MLLSSVVLDACGGGSSGGGGGGSITPTPTSTPAPTPTPTPVSGPAWFSYGHDAQHTAVSTIASQDLGRVAWSSTVDRAPQYSQNGDLLTPLQKNSLITRTQVIAHAIGSLLLVEMRASD